MAEDKRVFAAGGMDMDTEERFIASNDYRYALNCRVQSSDGDNVGVVENIKGNEQLHDLIDDVKYEIIGSYEDKSTHALYYFVCDTQGSDHKIISNFSNGNWFVILEGPYLNFNKNFLITGVNLIIDTLDYPDGILYWTDNFNEPRKLDVNRALLSSTATSFPNKYLNLDEEVIKAVLYPPTNIPLLSKGVDDKRKESNYIKGNVFQFKYRYIYRNNGKSAWSPISDIMSTKIGTYEEELYGIERQNYIEVQVDSGSYEVKSIEVSVRKTQDKEDFYLVGTVNKDDVISQNNFYLTSFGSPGTIPTSTSDGEVILQNILENTPLYFIFRNNELLTPLPLQESIRLFDDVPQLAKSQELIDGNRLTYGNIVNGYDSVETDTELEVIYQDGTETLILPIGVDFETRIHGCENACKNQTDPFSSNYPPFGCECYNGRVTAAYRIQFVIPESGGVINIPDGANVKIQINDALGSYYQSRKDSTVFSDKHINTVFGVSIDVPAFIWGLSGVNNIVTISDLKNHLQNVAVVTFKEYSFDDDGIGLKLYPGYDTGGTNCMPDNPEFTATFPVNQLYTGTDDFWRTSGVNKLNFMFSVYSNDWLNTNGDTNFARVMWGGSETNINSNPSYWEAPNARMFPSSFTYHRECGDTGWHGYEGFQFDDFGGLSTPSNPLNMENNSLFTNIVSSLNEYRGFKSGAEHGFGIVYYDKANRSTSVNQSGEIYTPLQPERGFVFPPTQTPDLFHNPSSIKFTINHAPPDWASHYQIVYTGSKNLIDFVHLNVNFIRDEEFKSKYTTVLEESQAIGSAGAQSGYQSIIKPDAVKTVIKMDMEALILRTADTDNHKISWSWATGDRVRFIHRPSGMSLHDYEIVGIEEDASRELNQFFYILGKEAVKDFANIGYTTGVASTPEGEDVFVEIYRPEKETNNNMYYEFGHVNPIIFDVNLNRVHSVNSNLTENSMFDDGTGLTSIYYDSSGIPITTSHQNQIIGVQPAIAYLRWGDIHWRLRPTQTALGDYKIEDFSYSDYFKSFGWGEGRPNVFLSDYKRTHRDSTIFYSEPYVANTNINGLSTFYPDVSFQEYDKRFNSIQKLHSINDSLIIFQEDKVSRAMVSRDVLFDASGEQNVAISKNVLSPAVPYVGEYGICKNPESFAAFGFRSYFFDIRRGAVMRLSQDGLTPISEARMKNFFTDYCEEIMDEKKVNKFRCYAAYDDKFDEYVISTPTIKWVSDYGVKPKIAGFTVGFNETGKKWNSFYSYSADWLESFGTGIVSWRNGAPYKHNSSIVNYNTFYNTPYISTLYFPSNVSPSTTKIYNNIAEESTDIWEVEINTRNGQNTTITTQEFTNGQTFVWEEGHGTKENIHHSFIKGDLNSPGGKIEGDRIRDTSIMTSLTLPIGPAQEENTLFSVKFGITPSGSPDLLGNVQ